MLSSSEVHLVFSRVGTGIVFKISYLTLFAIAQKTWDVPAVHSCCLSFFPSIVCSEADGETPAPGGPRPGGRRGRLRPHACLVPRRLPPTRPNPSTHGPGLTSWADSEQEGGGEHQQQKQQQAAEGTHGAAAPASRARPGELSASPARMALLFIRAPGEGRGTHRARPSSRPSYVGGAGHAPRKALATPLPDVAAGSQPWGSAGSPGSHVTGC